MSMWMIFRTLESGIPRLYQTARARRKDGYTLLNWAMAPDSDSDFFEPELVAGIRGDKSRLASMSDAGRRMSSSGRRLPVRF